MFLERGEWRLEMACLGDRRRMLIYRWSLSVSISSSTFHSEFLLAVTGDAHVKSTTDSPCQRIQVLASLFKRRRSRLAAHSFTPAHPLASIPRDPHNVLFALKSPAVNSDLLVNGTDLSRSSSRNFSYTDRGQMERRIHYM